MRITAIALSLMAVALTHGQAPSLGDPAAPTSQPAGSKTTDTFRSKIILIGAQRPGDVPPASDPASGGSGVLALRPDGTNLATLVEPKKGEWIFAGRIAPNGQRLALSVKTAGKKQPDVWIMAVNAQREKLIENGMVVAWSPDSTRLLCSRGEHNHWESFIVDIEKKQEHKLPIPETDCPEDWSPDGKRLTITAGNQENSFKHPDPKLGIYPLRHIYLWNLQEAKREGFTAGPMQDNIYSRYSPDGKWIAYGQRRYHQDGSLRHSIMVRDQDGNNEREIIHFDKLKMAGGYESFRESAPPCWSPNGKLLISLADRTKWELTGRPGMEMVNKMTMALVSASPEKGVDKQVDLHEMGVMFVGSIDWR